jgi:hypothetical protein
MTSFNYALNEYDLTISTQFHENIFNVLSECLNRNANDLRSVYKSYKSVNKKYEKIKDRETLIFNSIAIDLDLEIHVFRNLTHKCHRVSFPIKEPEIQYKILNTIYIAQTRFDNFWLYHALKKHALKKHALKKHALKEN